MGMEVKKIYSCKGKDTGEEREIRMKKKMNEKKIGAARNFSTPAITFSMV